MFLQRPILSAVVLASFAFTYPAISQSPQTRPAPGNNQGGRPPGGGNSGGGNSGGNRPNPGGGNPGGGNSGGGNRPNPGAGNPGGGNRPNPGPAKPGGPPPRPNPGNGGNRPNPGNGGNRPGPGPGGNRPGPGNGGNRPGPSRPPQWGRPPQQRPVYNFRPNDRSYLRRYYLRNLGYINRANRPRFLVGGFFPFAYISYLTPLPPQLYGYLPPPPPGYAMGYYDGYVVIYDPVSYYIANVVDLMDN